MLAQGRDGLGKTAYECHQPEQTLLYQLVETHYPALVDQLAQQGKSLPDHVHREFEAYVKCGRLEHGFLRVRCDKCHFERLVAFSCKKRGFCPSCGARRMAETAALLADEVFPDVPLRQWVISFPFPLRYLFAAHPQAMGKVLGIVYRAISTHLVHKSELSLKQGATGAVTLIQRFGSALNLNIHFHILFLDGVYVYRDNRPPRFQRVKAPDKGELEELVQLISQRVGRCLERQGLLEQDTERAWLDLDPAEDTDATPDKAGWALPLILGSSITYCIAVGPQQGRKAFMIRTIRPLDRPDPGLERVARANGFSLHAGLSCEGHQKEKRERLCPYIARPAVAVPRLSLSSTGKVVYTLKTPYSDGTTQVAFDRGGHPHLDFIARLAALAWLAASKAEGQSHPLPRRTRAEPSLARARHASQARERQQVHLQRRSPHTCRTSCSKSLPRLIGHDLGPAPKTCVQYRHRGLRPLRWICQGHRRGVEPV